MHQDKFVEIISVHMIKSNEQLEKMSTILQDRELKSNYDTLILLFEHS